MRLVSSLWPILYFKLTNPCFAFFKGAEDEIGHDMQYISPESYVQQDDDQQQGWVSWAWSFVPAIVGNDDEEGDFLGIDDGTTMNQHKSQAVKDPIVSIGFYCTKATITFKVTLKKPKNHKYISSHFC